MPNFDELVDEISQIIAERKLGMYILQHWISRMRMDKYRSIKKLANSLRAHINDGRVSKSYR